MDFATFSEVRARIGGVKGVIRALGDAPPFDHKWGSFPKCPFCDHKDSAGVFLLNGADHFKCHYTSCSTGGRVVTETGYINLREGLSEDTPAEGGPSPAYKRLLELAGAYVDPATQPKPEPTPAPAPVPPEPKVEPVLPNPVLPPDVPLVTEPADDVALIRQAIELIRKEKTASLRMLQSGLRLGYGRALRIMDGLERWGVVGPSVPGEKFRVILNLPEAGAPPLVQSVGVIEPGSDNPVAETVPEGCSSSGPAFINDGVPGSPGSPPLANGGPVPPQLSQQKPPSVPPVLAAPGAGQAGKLDEKPALAPGYAALRWFYDRLFPTSSQMQAYMPDGSAVPSPLRGGAGGSGAVPAAVGGHERSDDGEPVLQQHRDDAREF